MRGARGCGAVDVVCSALVGAVAAAWLTGSQQIVGEDVVEQAAAPVEAPLPLRSHRLRRRGWLLRRGLLLADLVALLCAVVVVDLAGAQVALEDPVPWALGLGAFCVWVLLAQGYGLYANDEIQAVRSTADDVPGVILLVTLTTWIGVLVLEVAGISSAGLGLAIVFWLAAIPLLLAARATARSVVRHRFVPRERTLIVGAGQVGSEIARKLSRRPEYGLEVIGFLDDDPLHDPLRSLDGGPPQLGGTSRIEAVLRGFRVERVIFAFSRLPVNEQIDLFHRCMELGVQVDIVPRLYEVIGSRMQVHDVEGLPLVGLRAPRLPRSSWLLKRCLDLFVSAALLVLLAPLFAFVALRIKLESPGPVLFRQDRVGAEDRRFRILKFRTMYADAEERKEALEHLNKHTEPGPRMFKIPEDPRITPFGRFLRRWSIDELPQLWNVLRGEMSLVGPRPLILAEDENVVGTGRQRLRLTPGVTGLWQVLGRSDIPFREMITLDYLYVTNWSLWGDVKLLARTIPRVLQKSGAY
ncbi:MAG TPA: sugar transferase [Gaiellaceae bacterium]|nr:sugar transferase [Gaiellaceae bacterium]